ncbi:MAG: hypothetical protein F7C82_01750 [Desulfurococcales archaeon]|nr:hypothetical protein [Desulfurococcales archaeon]MCE4622527.1 hypothetical protein [Desulfurococcales archaeon]MCE4628984.1 hypothetical protein [Desulfurococcales archaeon]NOZ31092.1 hypothetical protein [Thermoproteota archaeon]
MTRYSLLLVTGILLFTLTIAPALAQTTGGTGENTTLQEVVSVAVSNPKMALTILIEFLLGVALGYVGVKAMRYIFAFIGILILGSILSAWSLGGNLEDIAAKLGVELKQLLPLLKQFVITIGATIVGPASIGVIVGVILAMVKK